MLELLHVACSYADTSNGKSVSVINVLNPAFYLLNVQFAAGILFTGTVNRYIPCICSLMGCAGRS